MRVCGVSCPPVFTLTAWLLWLLLAIPASAASPSSPVRVSAWYWLNSTGKQQWPADFKAMRELGITDVVLVWGLDAAAFSTRISDSHAAIRAAHQAGLGSYLFVWHARHNALTHDPRFQQMDAAGHTLFAFDTFNTAWRATQWKTYLQTLARAYGREPGMAGYVFDNSFAIGDIGTIDGPSPDPAVSFLSYGAVERKMFGKPLPLSPGDPAWPEWTRVRQLWWAQWASDTRSFIRAIDANPKHKIILEDGDNTIDPDAEARAGFNLGTVIASFDNMHAYWAPSYSAPGIDDTLASSVTTYLARMRAAVGPGKELSLSLRLSEGDTEDTPGHAEKPTLDQIRKVIDAALTAGVRDIDLYGYRMGVYHLDGPGWRKYRPGRGATYPLTGQIEGKFLVDRPELSTGLRAYFQQIESTPSN